MISFNISRQDTDHLLDSIIIKNSLQPLELCVGLFPYFNRIEKKRIESDKQESFIHHENIFGTPLQNWQFNHTETKAMKVTNAWNTWNLYLGRWGQELVWHCLCRRRCRWHTCPCPCLWARWFSATAALPWLHTALCLSMKSCFLWMATNEDESEGTVGATNQTRTRKNCCRFRICADIQKETLPTFANARRNTVRGVNCTAGSGL